jgi:putative ABC transport system ATP-binding protein
MAKQNIMSVRNLVKTYGKGNAKTNAVKKISFDIIEGEFVALSGPSGSGKTTTFHQISLLDKPTSGSIYLCGEDISNLNDDEKSEFRLKKIGYVFQHYELLSELTALENVCLPLIIQKGYTKDVVEKAEKILEEMGLTERKNHYPNELSGGEQQRVAIARALIKDPKIILADEPTANLDSVTSLHIMKILKELNKKRGITFFIINHEKEFENFFNKIIRLRDGQIEKTDKK